MKSLLRIPAFICLIAALIVFAPRVGGARVIAGDAANAICTYYFFSHTNGIVQDYSDNDLDGTMFDGANIATLSGRQGVFFPTNDAHFYAWNDNKRISIDREFTIVAWVSAPRQQYFEIRLVAYNVNNPLNLFDDDLKGSVALIVNADGSLQGEYEDEFNIFSLQTERLRFNNIGWNHIALTVGKDVMRLYLNGTEVHNWRVAGHRAFSAKGTSVETGSHADAMVDDIGMFKEVFSPYDIRLIYNVGLVSVMNIAAVDPNDKIATTWGALKSR